MEAAKIGRGAAAFGAVGVLCAAQVASLLRVACFEHDEALSFFALPILLPAAMAFVGGVVARLAVHPKPLERAAAIALVVPAVGLLAGLVGGLVWWPEDAGEAAVDGLAFGGVALLVVTPIVALLARGARRDSIVNRANRLAVWAWAGAAVTVVSVLTLPRWKAYATCDSEPLQAVIATAIGLGVATLASVSLIVHALTARRLLATPPRFVDVGIGAAHFETLSHPPTAYRDVTETVSVVHGDVDAGRRALRAHALGAALCMLVAFAAASAGIVLRG